MMTDELRRDLLQAAAFAGFACAVLAGFVGAGLWAIPFAVFWLAVFWLIPRAFPR